MDKSYINNICITLALPCFGTFRHTFSAFLNYSLLLRITDEGSVPDMRIWSISLVKSDLKWCIHLSLILGFNDLVSVTAGGPRISRGLMTPSSTVDFG